ncbi:MAG TPA: AraC family transcriptional regulator [Microvirga sp.]|jgi:AraC family transcriptional regulator|nr:AraC family transcriptional regulator [Microvirga sp.]
MTRAEQDAGDWSDAPTPDLVVAQTLRAHSSALIDVGAGRFRIGRAPPGDFVVIPPGFATTFLLDAPHAIQMLAIPYTRLLDLAGSESGLSRDGDFGQVHAALHRDIEVSCLLDRLWTEGSSRHPHGALWADGALLQLAAALLRLRDGRPRLQKGGLAPWQQRRVTEYLADQLTEDVSLEKLAGVAGLSTFHFARAFRQSMGLPPHAYLRRLRVERAKALLSSTDLSVGDIAASTGYDTPQAFARMFRAEVGTSPSAYRRERRG